MALNHKAYEFRGNAYRNLAELKAWTQASARSRRSNRTCRSSIRIITCGTAKSAAAAT